MVDKDEYYECVFVHDNGKYKIREPVLVRKDHTGCIRNATFKSMEAIKQGEDGGGIPYASVFPEKIKETIEANERSEKQFLFGGREQSPGEMV